MIMINEWKSHLTTTERDKGAVDLYLDTLFVIDSADHPHTHLSNLTEGWLFQTDVSEDLDHSFSYADTSVLCTKMQC